MLSIAVCDNRITQLEETCALLSDYFSQKPEFDASIRCFQSSYDMMECLEAGKYFDVYFLEADMPEFSGIAIGRAVRQKQGEEAALFYLSESKAYAFDAYQLHAYAYLLRPCGGEALYLELDHFIKAVEKKRRECFLVKTHGGFTRMELWELAYAESRAHAYYYFLADGGVIRSVVLRESFDQVMAPVLQDERFLKANASFIVNMTFVRTLTGSGFLMRDGKKISISRGSFQEKKKAYLAFLVKRGLIGVSALIRSVNGAGQ